MIVRMAQRGDAGAIAALSAQLGHDEAVDEIGKRIEDIRAQGNGEVYVAMGAAERTRDASVAQQRAARRCARILSAARLSGACGVDAVLEGAVIVVGRLHGRCASFETAARQN